MKIVFIHHSCFLVETDQRVLIFDWFAGEKVSAYSFGGILPEYESDTPIYVFASHKHQDHFDMDVLRLAEKYRNIQFILSKDCKMTPNFMKKHGINQMVREQITYVSPRETYEIVGGVQVETLRSNDAGVAFYVTTDGISIFHAGDLNDWWFEGVSDIINWKAQKDFRTEINHLASKEINFAFFPADPRLGDRQWAGMEYMLERTKAEYVFPMHMWRDYTGIEDFLEKQKGTTSAERMIPIQYENEEFDFHG